MRRRRWGVHQSAHSSSGTSKRRAGSALLPSPRATAPPLHPALRPPQLPAGPRTRLPRGQTASHRLRFAWDSRRTQPGLKPPRPQRRPHHSEGRLRPSPQTTARREGCPTSGRDRPRPSPLRVEGFRLNLPGHRRRATGGRARSPERAGSLHVGWKVPVCRAATSQPPLPKRGVSVAGTCLVVAWGPTVLCPTTPPSVREGYGLFGHRPQPVAAVERPRMLGTWWCGLLALPPTVSCAPGTARAPVFRHVRDEETA